MGRKRKPREKEPTPNQAGALLGQLIELNGWTQTYIEDLVRAGRGNVGRFISGERKPGRDLSVRIRDHLGIDPMLWSRPIGKTSTAPVGEGAS